jgi:hypothetical protein
MDTDLVDARSVPMSESRSRAATVTGTKRRLIGCDAVGWRALPWHPRACILILTAGLSLAELAATSSGQIFISNNDFGIQGVGPRIGEYTFTGATVNPQLVGGYASGLNDPEGLAESGGDVFVANYTAGTIGEYTTLGATVNPALVSGLVGPLNIAVDGGYIYVINALGNVGEYTTSGAVVNPTLLKFAGNDPVGIAAYGGNLYTNDLLNHTVSEYTSAGVPVNTSLITGIFGYAIAVANGNIFVANSATTVGEYTLSGAVVNASLISGVLTPPSIAVLGNDVFVMSDTNNYYGIVGEYTTAGATVNASLISNFYLGHGAGMTVVAPFAGDVNYDGIVNGLDINSIANHWLQTGPNTADANFDGIVNGLDVALVAGNWLSTIAGGVSGGTAVPEPSTLILSALGGLALAARRRHLAWRMAP